VEEKMRKKKKRDGHGNRNGVERIRTKLNTIKGIKKSYQKGTDNKP